MVQKLLYTLRETASLFFGDGNNHYQVKVKEMITEGEIRGVKVGKRLYVPANEIEKLRMQLDV